MRPQPMRKAWFKDRLFIAAPFGALLIAGCAFAAWRVFFNLSGLTETDTILQANFVNNTGDPSFDNSLDNALEVKRAESPFLSLLPEPRNRP